MTFNGREVDKLSGIREKVFNNIKLTKAEEYLLETVDEKTPTQNKSYTKALFNLPFGGQIYPLTESTFGSRYVPNFTVYWQTSGLPVVSEVPDSNIQVPVEEEKMKEYCGLYQLIAYEETGGFTHEQIISARWLTKDMDAEALERRFSMYAQGYSDANDKLNDDWDNNYSLNLVFTPVGDNNAVFIDMGKYYT